MCVCVPCPQVFLREAERRSLQAALHTRVLRLLVALQRRFRARLERGAFLRMREASVCIQVLLLTTGLTLGGTVHGFTCALMKRSFV